MSERVPRASGILAAAGLGGAGTLVVELSAVRLMAPWFGTSAAVWTNVIGVILLALALGYLIGARLSERGHPGRRMGLALLAAGAITAWLPAGARPVCRLFLPEGLPLHEAAPLFFWGSLAATLLLFLPPALLLGCVGPLAVEAVQRRRGSHAGTAGGQVLGASTLGSLVGTFATTHALLPGLGLEGSFRVAGIVLAGPGLFLWLAGGGRAAALGAPLGLLLAGALFAGARPPALQPGLELLDARQSPYQALRVVEDRRGDEPLRLLQVNEGLDSFQSVWRPDPGLLGEGYYYDYFALPAWWSDAGPTWRVLVLGLGAGTTARVLAGASPPGVTPEVTGAEIDPAAVELGRAWFGLDDGATRVLAGWDARAALRGSPGDHDLIVLDAYAHQTEIPEHLSTLEFFREVRAHLGPGGWLAVNVGGFGFDDPVVSMLADTVSRAFGGEVLALRVPSARNFVLYARRDAALPAPDRSGWRFEGPVAAALLSPVELPGGWRILRADEDAAVASDDWNPLSRLQRRSLREGRARLQGRL